MSGIRRKFLRNATELYVGAPRQSRNTATVKHLKTNWQKYLIARRLKNERKRHKRMRLFGKRNVYHIKGEPMQQQSE